jgi:chromosome segregation ATPase
MSVSTSIETLREALAPVEALRGEHSQLESWVRESFTAMDALHGELSDWQRDLTRQQAQLDQREAALQEGTQTHESEAVATLEQQLSQSRDETRQLEEENAEQLQALEELDRQLAIAKAELRLVAKHAEERAASLEMERERADEERRLWTGELREMRRVLERLSDLPLVGDAADVGGSHSDDDPADETAVGARAAELRRRANSRRAAQQQRRPS